MRKMKTKATFAVTAMLMMVMGVLAVPAITSAGTVTLDSQIDVEDGATDILGGGDHFFVKSGPDAAFGIVWGTDTYENCVYFVAIKARYLGLAQVYNNDGEQVEDDREVKIYTMYWVKLDSMLEFDDSDQDGLLNYTRSFDGEDFRNYAYGETVYKKIDLNTAWDASEVMEIESDDGRSWELSLTARDLPYELMTESAEEEVGDGVLNELTLTFHFEAGLVQKDDITLPQWRVAVTNGPLGKLTFMNADRLDDIQVSGKVMKYDLKWDQAIEGWDYDPANVNPAVLIEFHSMVGNFVSPLMATWMEIRMLSFMNAVAVMSCESTTGDLEVDETTGTLPQPKELVRNLLHFGSDWSDVGNLSWVGNVTVDGEPGLVKAQVMAGHQYVAAGKVGNDLTSFTGFITMGAMVFPGGTNIVHDPMFSSEALVDVSTDGGLRVPVFLLLAAAVVIIVVVVVIAAVSAGGKKPGKGSQDSYERTRSSQPGEWTKYYDKK